jgi:SAM-dependent methyltransferase
MNYQKETYDILYKTKEFVDLDLPDYKISDGKIIKNKNILVLGVGSGRDVKYLVSNNKVIGLDISTSAIKQAKKNGVNARLHNLQQVLPFNDSYFDVVVAKDILEHLENPMFALSEIRRVVKPSGYVVISVPNHFYFPFRLRILLGGNLIWKTIGHDHTKLFEEWNYMHLRFFTWKGFQKFLDLGGFRIVKTFWDFGTLGHYSQPETVFSYIEQTKEKSLGRDLIVSILKRFWLVFNFVFPRNFRRLIVSLDPAIFSAGFYVWVKKR